MIRIYRNEELVYEMRHPIIGESSSWVDTEMKSGITTYRIIAVNDKGESASTSTSLFIGRDVPATPGNASLTILENNKARITWSAPAKGMNNGWFDLASLTYKITRLPDSIVVSTSTTELEFTDTSITSLNSYSYEIQAITQDGMGGKVVTKPAIAGPSITVPYRCDFATDDIFSLWNITDANNDDYTWKRETTLKAARYYYNEDGTTPGDDWLISSPIRLEKDKLYRLSFKLQSYDESYPEKLSVYLGTGKSVANQTTHLGEYIAESSSFTGFKVMLPENLETGDYHLSFHCHSDPEMFILYLTDILLEEVSEGNLSGMVTDGIQPLENTTISIKELDKNTRTDTDGHYKFEELKTGNYTVSFSKMGYYTFEKTDVKIMFGESTTVNASLNPLPVYSVSGKVLNIINQPVEKAKISLSGYNSYSTLTDANGAFSLPEVYQADQYKLVVERYGLCNDTVLLDVKNENLVLKDVVLNDKLLSPYLVNATENNGEVTVNWREPVDNRIFRHDNGMHAGRLGTTSSTVKSVYGSVFRTASRLTGMTWFTEKFLTSHPTVNIFVFDLDEKGEPTSKILYSKMNVPNKDLQWTTFEFPAPVDAPNGYMLALSYDGHVGLGLDNGEGPEYPFMTNTNCYSEDYTTGQFTYTETHDIKRTLMIRGIGILKGENEMPAVTSEKKYSVWRLTEDQMEVPEQWELLTSGSISERTYTDTGWKKQKQGFYRYAVKTLFNNGKLSSNAAFTQMLMKDMFTHVTVKVKTNTPKNEAKGAKVTLINTDNNPGYVYTGVIDSEGKVSFNNVWKGKYKAQITHKGFEDLISGELDFTTESIYETTEIILKEYIVNPFNLDIIKTDKEGERMFSWNVVDYIFDDFESHQDFTVNSTGNNNWTYIDGDGKKTVAMDGVKFPHSAEPMAYIVFNPYQTDPNLAKIDPNIRSYSGTKFLGTFPANPGSNNDFIISPELSFNKDFTFKFFAKSYTDTYGPEQMNAGYSLTGKNTSDFNWLNGDKPVDIPMGNWKEYKYTIPAEAKYVTINCVSNDAFIFMLDDIFIGIELPEGVDPSKMKQDISYEVYLDGKKQTTTQSSNYLLNKLSQGKHKAAVKAIFSSITTPMIEIDFDVKEGSGITDNQWEEWSIAPNPAKDIVKITGEYDLLIIYNPAGVEIARYPYQKQIYINDLTNGLYFLKIIREKQSKTFKLTVCRD